MRELPSLWLELTPRCNLACQFCYNPWRGGSKADHPEQVAPEVLRAQIARVLDRVEFGYVALSGGEPLLYDDLVGLTRWLTERGQRTILTTNGRLLRPGRVSALREAGLGGVQVSLLGSRARTHDELAGRSSWVQALQAIAHARAAGLSTSATFIATATNLDELPRMPELVSHLGVTRIVVNELQPVGSAHENLDELDVSGERFEAVVREAQLSAARTGVTLSIVRFNAPAYTPTAGGWHRWSVSPDAQLKLCNHSSQTLGPLSDLEDDDLDGLAHHLSTGDYAALEHRVDSCRCFALAAAG